MYQLSKVKYEFLQHSELDLFVSTEFEFAMFKVSKCETVDLNAAHIQENLWQQAVNRD